MHQSSKLSHFLGSIENSASALCYDFFLLSLWRETWLLALQKNFVHCIAWLISHILKSMGICQTSRHWGSQAGQNVLANVLLGEIIFSSFSFMTFQCRKLQGSFLFCFKLNSEKYWKLFRVMANVLNLHRADCFWRCPGGVYLLHLYRVPPIARIHVL